MSIFLTADTHFGHAGIVGHCNRPFENCEHMHAELIARWNAKVKTTDTVYVVGDFAWKATVADVVLPQLNGAKILIVGNHDDVRARHPWKAVHDKLVTTINGVKVTLNHEPMRTWPHDRYGAMHFHGHTHGTVKPWGWSFDVGVDCWDFAPVLFEDAVARMQTLTKQHPANDGVMPPGQIWNTTRTYPHSFDEFFMGER